MKSPSFPSKNQSTAQRPHWGVASPTRRLVTLVLSIGTAAIVTGLSIPSEAWAAEESRSVTGFQAVALEGAMSVKVSLAEKESVRVSGPAKDVTSKVVGSGSVKRL